ncbi:hypothetical protein JCM8208_004523 [Rhodotorula glutinis]
MSSPPASPPASSAAAPVVEPDDPLFRQVKALYSFFKDSRATNHREESMSVPQYNALRAVHLSATRTPPIVAQAWDDLSQAQHELLVDLLLKYYCNSRASGRLEEKSLPIAFQQIRDEIGYHRNKRIGPRGVPAPYLDTFKRLDTLLGLPTTLYAAPIEAHEFTAYEAERREIGHAHGRLVRAQSGEYKEYAQGVYDDAEAQLKKRLAEANVERVEHLQQIKAAFSLLHDNAALVPGFTDASQHTAVEVYFSRLDPGQRAAVVARVRNFVFAACEERAVRGEALDPDHQLSGILVGLHAHDLGHALCAARLNSIVYFVESHNAPPPVVEHFQGIVDQFCGDTWTRWFPQLALSQQLYAVGMVRALIGRIQRLKVRQVADELAIILPMDSSNPTSWKHAPKVDGPPVALRSLAHRPSTHHAPSGADSTSSSTSSRYFPQARSARW